MAPYDHAKLVGDRVIEFLLANKRVSSGELRAHIVQIVREEFSAEHCSVVREAVDQVTGGD